MRVVIIDNYDSFTYNLVQAIGALIGGNAMTVIRNDAAGVDDVVAMSPTHVVISPGPGRPVEAGISMEVIRRLAGRAAMLGVCLGHQCLAEALGGRVVHAGRLMHGKTSRVRHDGAGVFRGLPSPLTATRYHSLIVDAAALPDGLVPTAWTEAGELMGMRHLELRLEGVQFHPESFLTEHGGDMLANFLEAGGRNGRTGWRFSELAGRNAPA